MLLSLIVPLIGVTIYFCIHGYRAKAFFKIWMLHSLEMLGAIEFTSIFCLLLGQSGMLVNLPLLLIQTISSGAVLTQDMMPGFFRAKTMDNKIPVNNGTLYYNFEVLRKKA